MHLIGLNQAHYHWLPAAGLDWTCFTHLPRPGDFDQQTSGQHKVVRLGMMHQPPGSLLLDEGWAHEGGANSLLR